MASDSYAALGGSIAQATSAAWAQRASVPKVIDWLPRDDTPVFEGGPPMHPRWYRFFRKMAERQGGISGPSVTEVAASVTQVQTQVVEFSTLAQSAASSSAANTASIDVIREVAVGAGLPGAGQIP